MPENRLRVEDVGDEGYRWFAVYLVDRAFGGPEEGGWWYDYGNVELMFPISCLSDAHALMEIAMKAGYDNEGRRDIGSVLSEGVYDFVASFSRPTDWPEQTPHYE